MSIVFSTYYSLELPEDWQATKFPECMTVSPANGFGALQFSGALKDEGVVTDEDLHDFAENSIHRDPAFKPIELDAYSGIEFRYDSDGSSWREWYLRAGNHMLYITYNCDLEYAGRNDRAVDAVLLSLRRIEC